MKICVIGMGYVGAVTSACLAHDGHDVVGVDIDETKLELIRQGKSPVVEEGIQEVTERVVADGHLRVQQSIDSALRDREIIFVCVGTPSEKNGGQDLSGIRRVSEQLGLLLRETDHYPVLVYRSTVQPGTTDQVVGPVLEELSRKKIGTGFGLCFQPEFLREGSSIADFYNPPYTVIGGDSDRSIDIALSLFEQLDGDRIRTDIRSGELLKLTCNAFHALKVSFANEIGRIGHSLAVDPRVVMDLVCRDNTLNISPAYLMPGFAFGGSCLPKDLRSLMYAAKSQDLDIPVIGNVIASNDAHLNHVFDLVTAQGSRLVGFMGLSFKQGTDDLRESPLVRLAETLIGKGYQLMIYDPAVKMAQILGSNRRFIEETIPHLEALITEDTAMVSAHADVLVIGHKTQEIIDAATEHLRRGGKIVDLVGVDLEVSCSSNYVGACWINEASTT